MTKPLLWTLGHECDRPVCIRFEKKPDPGHLFMHIPQGCDKARLYMVTLIDDRPNWHHHGMIHDSHELFGGSMHAIRYSEVP